MTETMSTPGATVPPPGAEPLPPAGAAVPPAPPRTHGSDRFFAWIAGLGLTRTDGWLGGVCAGIAARLRIDPVIVRGVFVVVTLFGFPLLLVYAIAWALLPDVSGRIHLRELFHGRFDSALAGIAIMLFAGFFPVFPWLWAAMWPFAGIGYSFFGSSPLGVIGALLGIAAVAGLVFLIVRSSNQGSAPADLHTPPGSVAPDSRTASANSDAPGFPGEAPAHVSASVAAGNAVDPDASGASGSAQGSATDAELTQWREQHEAWRVQNDAWRRQQQDAETAAREQARQERDATGAAFAAEAAERRRVRRATKPRTSFVFVVAVVGAAIVAGAGATLFALAAASIADFAAAIGLLAAALVCAAAMITAGLMRRRSGFLAFVTVVLVVAGIFASIVSGPRALTFGSVGFGTSTAPQNATQPFGSTQLSVSQLSQLDDVEAGAITIHKGTGDTHIDVFPGTVLELDASLVGGGVSWTRVQMSDGAIITSDVVYPRDGEDGSPQWVWRTRSDNLTRDGTTTQRVRIDQTGAGSVYVTIHQP